METTYRATVALNGELGSQMLKEGMTAPEIKLITYLHGLGSVTNIAMYGKIDTNSIDERERLNNIYKPEKVAEVFGNYGELPLDIRELKLDPNLFEKGSPIGLGGAKEKKNPTENNGKEHNTSSPAE
jgi:hypothetical protein